MNICKIENGDPRLSAAEQSHVNAFLGWINLHYICQNGGMWYLLSGMGDGDGGEEWGGRDKDMGG